MQNMAHGQQPMVAQGTAYDQPPTYQQPAMNQQPTPAMQSPPPNGGLPTYPMPGQQGAPQSPVGVGYAMPDGSYGVPLTTLGSSAAPVVCPNCGYRGVTNVEYESGGFTQ
jgi:hypothetical protein